MLTAQEALGIVYQVARDEKSDYIERQCYKILAKVLEAAELGQRTCYIDDMGKDQYRKDIIKMLEDLGYQVNKAYMKKGYLLYW